MDKMKKNDSERRKIYNSDKTSIQVYKSTHEKVKIYCKLHNLKIKNFIDEILLESVKN